MTKLKKIFDKARIVALAGEKHTGKTNNLISLIVDYREKKPDTTIYAYGMPKEVMKFLGKHNVREISSLKQMITKRDCILILDEFQKLKLNDRRYKDQLAEFIDFIYHRNVYVILSSPNVREFNSVIGSVIERWVLKSINIDNCVNGSHLKMAIDEYKGKYKLLGSIDMPKDEMLLINDEEEIVIQCPYIKQADTKKKNEELF